MSYTEQERLEATEWFIDIRDVEDPSPELLHDWMRWMEASESHRRAFCAVEDAWHKAAEGLVCRSPPPAGEPSRDDYDGRESVHTWRMRREACAARQTRLASEPRTFRRRRVWLPVATAAAIGAVALIMEPRLVSLFGKAADHESFSTRTGEQMQVTLPDGSQVNLGARSKLTIAYTEAARDVRLETGEAFFAVHKDAMRPFRVHVLNGVVTAVGTAFDVRTTNDRVVVAVVEGTVQVNGPVSTAPTAQVPRALGGSDPTATAVTRLRRGEAIDFVSSRQGKTIQPSSVTRVDPADPARWRQGWLVYRDEPLRDVLTDIGRYSDREIVIDDSLSINPHFTGAVFKDSVVEWLKSLPNAFPVTVTVNSSRITVAPIAGAIFAREPSAT
jgi:transmembrane sensor